MERFQLAAVVAVVCSGAMTAAAQAGGSSAGESQTGESGVGEPFPRDEGVSTEATAEPAASATTSLPQGEQDVETFARAEFQRAREAFDAGRFEEALRRFRRSHAASGQPGLLYNIGLVCERLRRDDEALVAFRAYLEELPQAPNRDQLEVRIAILERASRSSETEAAEVGEAEPEELPASSSWLGRPVWRRLLGAGGAALTAIGGVTFALSFVDQATVANGTRWDEIESAYHRVPVLSGVGLAVAGTGLLLVALAVVLALRRRQAPALASGSAGLAVVRY